MTELKIKLRHLEQNQLPPSPQEAPPFQTQPVADKMPLEERAAPYAAPRIHEASQPEASDASGHRPDVIPEETYTGTPSEGPAGEEDESHERESGAPVGSTNTPPETDPGFYMHIPSGEKVPGIDVIIPADEKEPSWQDIETAPAAAFTAPKEKQPGFWERNPDLEKFIGENLFNKIGIGILVIGIGFFLKYAIDKNWINETGRSFIGFFCGAVLIGLAHYLRKSFAAFSSVLVGGGVAVLYFTVTIAFQQYHLISQSVAFALMIVITAFTVLLSLSYNRKELAILAILGGFSSPFLVSTGHANEIVFFTYLLILNVGMLVLAYYKKWNVVNVICYVATILLYGGWLMKNLEGHARYGVPLLFGTLFYTVFFLMNVINNVRNRMKFGALEISILLSNTFLYYGAGMAILRYWGDGAFQGLFTALLAVFNCIFAYSLYRSKGGDRTLVFLLIGLVLTFMSLAAPIQLEGNHITLFWSAEAVLLLWLWQKSQITLMRYSAFLVLVLMFVSLIIDWGQIYFSNGPQLFPVFNKGLITGIVAAAAVWALRRLAGNEAQDSELLPSVKAAPVRKGLAGLLAGLLYLVISLELFHQLAFHAPLLTVLGMAAFNYLYIAILWRITRNGGEGVTMFLLLLSFGAALVMVTVLNGSVTNIRDAYVAQQAPFAYFLFHYLVIALLVWVGVCTYRHLQRAEAPLMMPVFKWVAAFVVLYLLSAELDHLLLLITRNQDTIHTSHRTGYAILWGLYAFVLMFMGLRLKSKDLRIISISVFGITIIKLFVFDLSGLGEGGKIAAFISLGILLLLISFMYQRLKKIILKDEESKP
ncbi:DUF2339 domain-containing protein [Chitinophaga lutea]|nr:DUF2339 domain-containing protein [Chitinophaga lutea]